MANNALVDVMRAIHSNHRVVGRVDSLVSLLIATTLAVGVVWWCMGGAGGANDSNSAAALGGAMRADMDENGLVLASTPETAAKEPSGLRIPPMLIQDDVVLRYEDLDEPPKTADDQGAIERHMEALRVEFVRAATQLHSLQDIEQYVVSAPTEVGVREGSDWMTLPFLNDPDQAVPRFLRLPRDGEFVSLFLLRDEYLSLKASPRTLELRRARKERIAEILYR